jgi:anti-sigma-K factor RskA
MPHPMVVLMPPITVQTEGDKRRRTWRAALWGVLAITSLAIALFAASFFRGRERDLARELSAAREQLRAQALQLTTFREAFAILNGPETATASFGDGRSGTPNGRVFVNPSQGILLVAASLPAPAAAKIYEMWLMPQGGKPVAAGVFQPAMDETALHIWRGPVDLGGIATVEVTLENAGGLSQPTSPPLIVARLALRP